MSWTKKQIIERAFVEIGLGDYTFATRPDEVNDALSALDALMAEWEDRGIVTGYTVVNDPDTDTISGDSAISAGMVRAVYLNLAVNLAPQYGKQVMPATAVGAKQGLNNAFKQSVTVPEVVGNYRSAPAGAGYKDRYNGLTTLPEVE